MGIEIMMCIMALFVNFLVVGCFAMVYGTRMKYENGMLFGIHIPKEAQQEPEVKTLMERYTVWMKQIYWWSTAGRSGDFRAVGVYIYLHIYVCLDVLAVCVYHRKYGMYLPIPPKAVCYQGQEPVVCRNRRQYCGDRYCCQRTGRRKADPGIVAFSGIAGFCDPVSDSGSTCMDTGRNGTFTDSDDGIFGNRRVLGASCVEQSKALRGI